MRVRAGAGRRIVLTSFGSLGDVYPYIGIGRELRARGHDVVLAMPRHYRAVVEREALGFHPVRPDLDPTDSRLVARIMDANSGTAFIVRDLVLGSLRETFTDLEAIARGADLLVSHPVSFAAPVVGERLAMPWASTVLAPMSFFSPLDLPVFPQMPWAKRLDGFPGVAVALVGLARLATRRWREPVDALRRDLGLSRGGHPVYEGQHSPHLVLGLFSRCLAAPPADAPAALRITGAIPYNGPETEQALPPVLEEFLAAGSPPIVFTLGTSAVGAAGSFYEASAEAVRRLGRRAILLVGTHGANGAVGLWGDDILRVAFAPHAALFPRAAAVVHQGGAGTLHQALRSGRPMLVVPFAHDQPDNAYRAEQLGVALTMRPSRYSGRTAAKALRSLVERPAFADRAREVGSEVRAEDGVTAACDAIDALLARQRGRTW
ncbi:MAG: glycosyltransferase [Vicinamibacterales bacterium]